MKLHEISGVLLLLAPILAAFAANSASAGDHAWLYVFNNDGVTKFADAPQTIDGANASDVRVTPQMFAPRFGAVTELISGKAVNLFNNAFSWRIGPGDLALFEFSMKHKARKHKP